MSSRNRPNLDSRRIDEELVAVDALKHVLMKRCGCKDVQILHEQNDPPDFTVTIDGETFPTEVTSIVTLQEYRAHCKEFAEAIRARAASNGSLTGKYAFSVFRLPTIPKLTSENGKHLIDIAVAFISSTQELTVSPEFMLSQDRLGNLTIEKVSQHGSVVGYRWVAPCIWEGDAQSQLAMLVQRAIDEKKESLQAIGISPQKTLLLLYDAYGYAQPDDAIAAMQQITGCDWFHSIFWAASFSDRENTTYPDEPGREGLFLFSNNLNWNRGGTI